ncbi:PepSY domain-containing protein [Paracoccus lichenicola]|nr:PepSY domain-containing protein [Paracoccus lichenicola]
MRIPILALVLLIASGPAPWAQDRPARDASEIDADSDLALAAVARGEILPLSALMPRLLAAHPGEVLDIEIDLDPAGRIEEYEFEMLTPEGRLIEVDMDARTGEITEVSDEDPEDDD